VAVATSLKDKIKAVDDMIFRIYRDIMANYESSDNKLKITYPKIIVDVVAILTRGVDTRGNKIPLHNLEHYYQMRKSDAITTSAIASQVPISTATAASIKTIKSDDKRREESILNKDEESELVEVLNKMTDRNKKAIQESIAKLDRRDIERIKDLCKNYNKLQKYSKLITDTDNLQKFKTALENETGRKLSEHQLQHAANSIRKAKLYTENVLDGKFIPHGSYGINHTKHNLEYGYLIVGLMQPSKRKTTTKK
jgi:K+/H+ antiporter YhaU regulatory subunit KhtT